MQADHNPFEYRLSARQRRERKKYREELAFLSRWQAQLDARELPEIDSPDWHAREARLEQWAKRWDETECDAACVDAILQRLDKLWGKDEPEAPPAA